MDFVELRSGCKINTYLNITGRLAGGYHTLETMMLPLDEPHDRILVTLADHQGCIVHSNIDGITPDNNTLSKSHKLYQECRPKTPGLTINLIKGIPTGAGLGGGSANAASLLLYLNSLSLDFGYTPLDEDTLNGIAARVGADVPFFLKNSPAWAEGIGEKLRLVENPYTNYHFLLVCPPVHVDTSWAYKEWDRFYNISKSQLTSSESRVTSSPAEAVLFNAFEPIVFAKYPELLQLKEEILMSGAVGSLMSGSGSSIFGLYEDLETAQKAYLKLQRHNLLCFLQIPHAGVSPSW